jgi:Coatomer epsilon subunit
MENMMETFHCFLHSITQLTSFLTFHYGTDKSEPSRTYQRAPCRQGIIEVRHQISRRNSFPSFFLWMHLRGRAPISFHWDTYKMTFHVTPLLLLSSCRLASVGIQLIYFLKVHILNMTSEIGQPDELYTLRTQFFLGHYQAALQEAKQMSRRPLSNSALKLEREEFIYRAYIALQQYDKCVSAGDSPGAFHVFLNFFV